MRISISKEHGLNPTLGVCLWCGEEDGTIGLLGANGGKQAPRHSIISSAPCPKCKAGMAQGITLIEASPTPKAGYTNIGGAYISRRWFVIKREAAERILTAGPVRDSVLRVGKGYLDTETFEYLLNQFKQAEEDHG